MKILVIDDLRNLLRFSPEDSLFTARNSKNGITLLDAMEPWDQVYFDHDLGGEDTIRPVVSMLEERAFYDDPITIKECFVHTSNSTGGDWIVAGLKAAGYSVHRIYAGDYFTS